MDGKPHPAAYPARGFGGKKMFMQNYTVFTDIEIQLGNRLKGRSYISTAPTVEKVLQSHQRCNPEAVVMRIVDNITKKEVYKKPTGAPSHGSWHC